MEINPQKYKNYFEHNLEMDLETSSVKLLECSTCKKNIAGHEPVPTVSEASSSKYQDLCKQLKQLEAENLRLIDCVKQIEFELKMLKNCKCVYIR